MSQDTLIQGLNEALSAKWGTIIRYTYQVGRFFGIMGIESREIFAREIEDELGHASFLTDMIVDLGGEPTTAPKEFEKPDTIEGMLLVDQEMELVDVEQYMSLARQAEELNEMRLKLKLEEMAADEASHFREQGRMLKTI